MNDTRPDVGEHEESIPSCCQVLYDIRSALRLRDYDVPLP